VRLRRDPNERLTAATRSLTVAAPLRCERRSADAEFLRRKRRLDGSSSFLWCELDRCFLGVCRWPGGVHRQGKGDGVVWCGVVREAQAEARLACS